MFLVLPDEVSLCLPPYALDRYLMTTGMECQDFLDQADEALGERCHKFLARQL